MPTPAPQPPPSEGPSLPVPLASRLLSSFTTFLTLSLHSLLYHRALYPQATFLTARALNLPVHQSRHPGLCKWINDAVAAVARQLQDGSVRRIVVVMHAPNKRLSVLERWVFDVEAFPEWGNVLFNDDDEEEDAENEADEKEKEKEKKEGEEGEDVDEEEEEEEEWEEEEEDQEGINWIDINEALRGALRRISHAAESKPPLPAGSTFTLAVELRDAAPAPIGVRCGIPTPFHSPLQAYNVVLFF
ncbi:DNA-binding protein [Mariannaea sp. PMI_226]|nr:DNA-binding protein [Mariannaea sp. PMI_226]